MSGNQGNTTKKRKITTGGFPKVLKTGTGLKVGKDLSHKVSAKATDVMFQTVSQNPSKAKQLLPSIKGATKVPKRQQKRLSMDLGYVEKHTPYGNAPMSPKSEQAFYGIFDKFANKNENNLRPRPDTENRSIGEYPHFNISQGNLSPRSKRTQQVVENFEQQYGSFLSPSEKQLTSSYTQIETRIKNTSTSFETEDQMDYATDVRNNKY